MTSGRYATNASLDRNTIQEHTVTKPQGERKAKSLLGRGPQTERRQSGGTAPVPAISVATRLFRRGAGGDSQPAVSQSSPYRPPPGARRPPLIGTRAVQKHGANDRRGVGRPALGGGGGGGGRTGRGGGGGGGGRTGRRGGRISSADRTGGGADTS